MSVRRRASVVWLFLLVAQTLVSPLSLVGPLDSLDEPVDLPVSGALGDPVTHVLPRRLPADFPGIQHLGAAPDSPRSPPAG